MGINYSNKQSPAALRHMCSRTPIRTVTTISSSTAVRRRLDLSGNCCLLFSLNLSRSVQLPKVQWSSHDSWQIC